MNRKPQPINGFERAVRRARASGEIVFGRYQAALSRAQDRQTATPAYFDAVSKAQAVGTRASDLFAWAVDCVESLVVACPVETAPRMPTTNETADVPAAGIDNPPPVVTDPSPGRRPRKPKS